MNHSLHTATGDPDGAQGTVVFIHGFPFDGSMWSPQLSALPPGWRGIAPDLRGFGETEIRDLPGEVPTGKRIGNRIARGSEPVLTMACFARDIAQLIEEEAGGRAVVCGLSMGGYVALELWRRHPERVRGLILADTRSEADDDEGRENRLRMAQTVRGKGMEPVAAAMLPSLLAPSTMESESDLEDRVREMILRAPPRSVIAALAGMAARHDATTELSSIQLPTLVIAGEDDAITPPEGARRMADAIPDAELAIVPGAGHVSNLENPSAFNASLTAFLERLGPGS